MLWAPFGDLSMSYTCVELQSSPHAKDIVLSAKAFERQRLLLTAVSVTKQEGVQRGT